MTTIVDLFSINNFYYCILRYQNKTEVDDMKLKIETGFNIHFNQGQGHECSQVEKQCLNGNFN